MIQEIGRKCASGYLALVVLPALNIFVKMALDELKAQEVIDLDEERKAAMISNLLVVLCGEENAQPILNTGSLYT